MPPPGPPPSNSSGEGIGLFIVKKLCELLSASFDVERRTHRDGGPTGMIYRVRFPSVY